MVNRAMRAHAGSTVNANKVQKEFVILLFAPTDIKNVNQTWINQNMNVKKKDELLLITTI